MDELRLILLVAGILAIALIYFLGMRSRDKARLDASRRRAAAAAAGTEPHIGADAASEGPDLLDRAGDAAVPPNEALARQRLVDVEIRPVADSGKRPEPVREAAPGEPEMMVPLTVMAPEGGMLEGRRIMAATRELELVVGEKGLIECYPDTMKAKGRPVFSIGHLLEPGSFDGEGIDRLQTPGLLLFVRLPGPVDGVSALELMVATAGQLAEKLGGIVCDERRNKMTNQALEHLRSEVAEFERRRRVRVRR